MHPRIAAEERAQAHRPFDALSLSSDKPLTCSVLQGQQSPDPGYGGAPPYGQQGYPPYGGPPQHGGYPQDHNYGQDRGHSPYPPQQQSHGGESASYYGGAAPSGHAPQYGQEPMPGAEGERGLGSTLIGGAAGALLGNKLGHGKMATAGGALAGAVGLNMANKAYVDSLPVEGIVTDGD